MYDSFEWANASVEQTKSQKDYERYNFFKHCQQLNKIKGNHYSSILLYRVTIMSTNKGALFIRNTDLCLISIK